MTTQIVKVQMPLGGDMREAFIYDQHRTFHKFVPVEAVARQMRGEIKKFFYAKAEGDKLVLLDEAPWQNW